MPAPSVTVVFPKSNVERAVSAAMRREMPENWDDPK
jgi:hypothetical protein